MIKKENNNWDNKAYRIWADDKNYSIMCFRCANINIEDLYFDTLYLHLSISRQIILFLREFMNTKSYELQQHLIKLLKYYWRNYYVDSFENKNNLNVLKG